MRCSSDYTVPARHVAARLCGIAGTHRNRSTNGYLWTGDDLWVAARCSEYGPSGDSHNGHTGRVLYTVVPSVRIRHTLESAMTIDCEDVGRVAQTRARLPVGSNVRTVRVQHAVVRWFHTRNRRHREETIARRVVAVRYGCPDVRCCSPGADCPAGCRSYRRSDGEYVDQRESVRMLPARRLDVQTPECRLGARRVRSRGYQCGDRLASCDSVRRRAVSCTPNTNDRSLKQSAANRTDRKEIAPSPPQHYTAIGVMA